MRTAQPLFFFLFSAITLLLAVSAGEAPASCTTEQERAQPCRCCKIGCWYTIASAATHQLGHMPGQAGEKEALATLRLIRACMISECSGVCIVRAPPAFLTQQ